MVKMTKKKQSKGRQKIEMVKMTNDSNLQVTFSKRRAGLFKKASELCTLCGAEIAVIVFSPGRKVFSFGHPEVESMIDRFLNGDETQQTSGTMQLIEAQRNATANELNMQLTEMSSHLDAAKKYGEELNQMNKVMENQCWWVSPSKELSLPQLLKLKSAMEELKKNVGRQAQNLHIQNTNSQQFHMAGSTSGVISYETRNNIPFGPNMVPEGYTSPNMMPLPPLPAPAPGFNPNPQGYTNPIPPQGYNIPNPPQGYNPGFGRGFY